MTREILSLQKTKCCPQTVLATDNARGEIYCESCGLVVVQNTVDNLHEGHIGTKDQYLHRTRAEGESKLSFHDRGLSTKIPFSRKDAGGNSISSKTQQKFKRLRNWDSRAKSNSNERRLIVSFTFLGTITSKLGLPDAIKEKAAYIYRKAMKKKLIQGRTIKAISAASLYVACREAGMPRSIDDIAKAANSRRKDLASAYRHLVKNIEIELSPLDAKSYVNRIANNVGANEKSKRLAWKILDAAKKSRLVSGKKPMGIAGASVYIAAAINDQRISYKQIEKSSHVSAVTLRKMVKIFLNKLTRVEELEGAVL